VPFLLIRFLWASKENEHLYTLKSLLLSSSFVCPKEEARKRHPAVPALRAPLCFSLLTERWKLTAFGGSDMPASSFVNNCDAQRDRMGHQKNKTTKKSTIKTENSLKYF